MITRNGKKLLAKYMLNIVPAFATHVAVGCGANPVLTGSPEESSNAWRKNLEFETARATIIGRGIVNTDGIDEIVFKAELPIENRYGVTEVGLFSEHRNVRAGQFDSKPISKFNAPVELWSIVNDGASIGALEVLTNVLNGTDIAPSGISGSAVGLTYVSSSNALWTNYAERIARKEQPRFGNGCIIVRGNYSNIVYNEGNWVATTENGIETSNVGINMARNSDDDEIRIAFSVASTAKTDTLALPGTAKINIWVEFVNNYTSAPKKYAKAKVSLDSSIIDGTRYIVHSFKKSDFVADAGFSWAAINGLRLFSSVQVGVAVSPDYWIVYDGLRLENVSSESPTYAMVAYTQVFTDDEQPLTKTENTNNFIEFRLRVEDLGG